MQAAVVHDVGAAKFLARADQAVGDAEPLAQAQRRRLLRQERVGPGFDDEAVAALGAR